MRCVHERGKRRGPARLDDELHPFEREAHRFAQFSSLTVTIPRTCSRAMAKVTSPGEVVLQPVGDRLPARESRSACRPQATARTRLPPPVRRRRCAIAGSTACAAIALPPIKPPPPTGTTIASSPSSSSKSSSAAVPAPATIRRVVERRARASLRARLRARRRSPSRCARSRS